MLPREPSFIVTVDVEGDNIWARPKQVTTRNARYLHRFQDLAERFGIRPTYLVNYEMAADRDLRDFARAVLTRGAGEIGMHLHAWNSPPSYDLTDDDVAYAPYLVDYPTDIIEAKVRFMTDLLEDTFQVKMVSHRAGRWALDERYAQALIANGYGADCSVTPLISWRDHSGAPTGVGGTDYTLFPDQPYWVDPSDIARPGRSPLLEVPLTTGSFSNVLVDRVVAIADTAFARRIDRRRLVGRGLRRLFPNDAWLVPNGRNRRRLLSLLARTVTENRHYAELALHSSELMPAGSPVFPSHAAVERLYRDLSVIFRVAQAKFRPATLAEFRSRVESGRVSTAAVGR